MAQNPPPPVCPVPGGVPVSLPSGRSKHWPDLWTIPDHPLAPNFGMYQGKIYFGLVYSAPETRKALKNFLDVAPIPEGTPDGIEKAGLLVMAPGDCLIVRDIQGSGMEEDDHVHAVLTPPELFSQELRDDIRSVRDDILGPVEERTAVKGGVAWERSPEAKSLRNADRCSSLTTSHQAPKQQTAPMASTRMPLGVLSEHQTVRKHAIQANAAIAVEAMELSLPHEAKLLRQRAEACNVPRVGHANNYFFPAMQLNLSPAAEADTAVQTFTQNMGAFAGKHIDYHDALNGWTHLLCHSDLHGDEDPGVLIIMTFGVCVRLGGLASLLFSGRHVHGGFPPTAKEGEKPHPHSYRMVIVSYPPSSLFDVTGKVTLGYTPEGPLNICKEFIDPKYDELVIKGTPTSMTADALAIMDEEAVMDYHGRSLANLAAGLTRQLPPSLGARFDVNQFLRAFTYKDPVTREERHLNPWELGPGSTEMSSLGCTRAGVTAAWADAQARLKPFFPELESTKGLIMAEEEGDESVPATTGDKPGGKHPREEEWVMRPMTRAAKKAKLQSKSYADLQAAGQKGHIQSVRRLHLGATGIRVSSRKKGNGKQRTGKEPEQGGEASTSQMVLRPRAGKGSDGENLGSEDEDTSDGDFRPPSERVPAVKRAVIQISEDALPEIWKDSAAYARGDHPGPHGISPSEDGHAVNAEPSAKPYEKVLATFSQPHLQKLLSKLQVEVKKLEADRALIQRYSGTPHKQIYMILEGLDKSSIFSPAFVSAFPSFWDAITVQEHKSNNHQLNLLLMRSQIMAAVGSAWTWLDVQFPAMCMAILRDEVDKQSAPWLYRLVQDVKKAHCHCGVVQLDPLSYDLRVPSTAARTFNFSDDDLEPSSEVLETCVMAVLHSTIRSWLAFPGPQSISRIQGTFVRHLTSVFGSGQVLLLDKVWNFYRLARTALLGDRLPPRHAFQPDMLSEFLQDLSALPLADSDSEERRILSQIEDAVTAHRALL
ncbi:uncharacterized protein TRAVEDRAFT_54600, partial [Trametes versicolor FP-101664 SS1]